MRHTSPHCPVCGAELDQDEERLHCCSTCESFFAENEIKYYNDNPEDEE